MAALEAHSHAPMDCEMLHQATGRPTQSIRDLLCEYKLAGKVYAVDYHHHLWYFATLQSMTAWMESHPEGMPPMRKKQHPRPLTERSRQPRVLAVLVDVGAAGIAVPGIAEKTGITDGNVRVQLAALEGMGKAWRCGGKYNTHWFSSQEYMSEASRKIDEQNVAKKMQEQIARDVAASKKEASKRLSQDKDNHEQAYSSRKGGRFNREITSEAKACKPMAQVVWPDGIAVQRRPTPRGRFEPSPFHRGEFASLGIGRYAE